MQRASALEVDAAAERASRSVAATRRTRGAAASARERRRVAPPPRSKCSPIRRISCLRIASADSRPRAAAMSAASRSMAAAKLVPWRSSIARTWREQRRSSGSEGRRTSEGSKPRADKLARTSARLRASCRKSSSAWCRLRSPSMRGRFSGNRKRVTISRLSKSASYSVGTSGYCTLTITSRPSSSVARCAWDESGQRMPLGKSSSHVRTQARLGDRGGADGLRVEGGEELSHRHTDVGFDDPAHLGEAPRRHAVLQRPERLDVRVLEDPGTHCGGELSNLDVDAAQPQDDVDRSEGRAVVKVLLRRLELARLPPLPPRPQPD
mmetsp:Transcript_44318/g.142730  ORF Transcript_44318/g.142730 Transcript_44318/m.142730 type:complete len:323 (+) Transcript_44318:779-1747(+)